MVIIKPQFCGPSSSGNGGYTSGLVAQEFGELAQVTLQKPPPLGRELTFSRNSVLEMIDAELGVIASAKSGQLGNEIARFVEPERITAARSTFPEDDHPFPRCFTCGTARHLGDGLQIYSPFLGDGVAAGIWRPHESFFIRGEVPIPIMWAAMDCPGYWAAGPEAQPAVLGRMTGEVLRKVEPNEDYISVGQLLAKAGRKISSLTAIFDLTGELVARSEQTWIEIDRAAFETGV